MPGPHQIDPGVVAGPDQVPAILLDHGGDPDRADLPDVHQPSQPPGVAPVGLHPIPEWALQLGGSHHHTASPRRSERAGQPEPGRAGLLRHRHRPG